MKISIIIATWNAAKTLRRCLDSIVPQMTNQTELIIVDGGSEDETNDIIDSYGDCISVHLSEPDKGIYDAWNKGIRKSHGDWIMFLGADDILLPGAIQAYLEKLSSVSMGTNIISSKLDLVDENGNHKRYVGEKFDAIQYGKRKCSFAHPGMLHSNFLFEQHGLFSLDYKICSDCEFFIRNMNYIQSDFVDKITVRMQQGGVSVSNAAIKEAFHIRKKYKSMNIIENYTSCLIMMIKLKLSSYKTLYLNMKSKSVDRMP